ncbi:DoxX family protein [Paludisphaera mucosa]|uniref:DoxX family protein n=1 Tax=Paludisphaera mucosa TaxID=3030827 RepID=A0ABT6FGV7_9BACT|nr:DoxX family protein [Paludisphaera mucosa]MDG3006818.1 DoxX family protein [Paludisphaera mucosa]
MATAFQGLVSVAGRVALSTIFLLSAVGNKIPNFNQVSDLLGSKGLPAPKFLLLGAIAFLVAGSLSVIAGWKTRLGALLLFLFLLPTTYLFHDFWNHPGQEGQEQMIQFMKNLSMAGAMLFLIANGGGAWSLDSRRSQSAKAVVLEEAVV